MNALIIVIVGMSVLAIFAVPLTERLAEGLGKKIGSFARKPPPVTEVREKILLKLTQRNLKEQVYLYPTTRGYEFLMQELSEEECVEVKSAMADLILECFPDG